MQNANGYSNLKLGLDGLLGPGEQHKRRILLDSMYTFMPKEPGATVLMRAAELAPRGYTNWHRHNGATLFVCTQARCSRRISRKARWSRPRPATSIPSRSANSIAATTRILSWPKPASPCA